MRYKDSLSQPVAIGPQSYTAWRATTLGTVTEALEHRLMLELMGELSGRRMLDVGCGDGVLVCAAASRGANVTGVDPDATMLAAAHDRAVTARLPATFLKASIEQLPFQDSSFDVVTAVTVLCFIDHPKAAMREMARVLKPGGRLAIGELGRWSLWAAIRQVRSWVGSMVWRHARFRTANELRALAEQAGLCVTELRGAVYYPPVGVLARVFAPIDPWLGRVTSFGAAFLALSVDAPADKGLK